ncbi:unnamed protein product, partial [Ascophyllum nodosum]
MHPPLSRRTKRRHRLLRMAARLSRLMDLLTVMDNLDTLENSQVIKHRSTLMVRERRAWALYINPMLGDGTFK